MLPEWFSEPAGPAWTDPAAAFVRGVLCAGSGGGAAGPAVLLPNAANAMIK